MTRARALSRAEAKGIVEELHRRAALVRPPYIEDLHPKQKELFDDPCRWKAAHPGRRGGKTTVGVRAIAHQMNLHPHSDCAYMALTLENAKKLAWKPMMQMSAQYGWGWQFNKIERTAYAPNGSRFFLVAGNKPEDIDKLRGFAYRIVVIDEAASFRAHLRDLIAKVIEPALGDHRGALWLIGSPGACAGYFYDACKGRIPKWSVHHWDVTDNTYFADPEGWLEDVLISNRWTRDHPVFRQEYLGEWVYDTSRLVYPYDTECTVDRLPRPVEEWRYVLALDFGVVDACAFVVAAYHPHERGVYFVEAYKHKGLSPSDFVEHARVLQSRYYRLRFGRHPRNAEEAEFAFETIVGDTAGTGKPFCQELLTRTGYSVQPAQKTAKLAFQQHMAGDMQTQLVHVLAGSCDELLEEWADLQWVDDARTKYDHKHQPDHCADAALYAWRECRPYDATPDEWGPDPGTPEWYAQQELLEEEGVADGERRRAREWEEAFGYELDGEM